MKSVVLDASALIAAIFEEEGGQIVEQHLSHAILSTVNMAEVATYMLNHGIGSKEIYSSLSDLALETLDYTEKHAFLTAELRSKTKSKGLSLGDRACLSLAISEKLPVLTADRAWAKLDLGVKIQLIR